MANFLLPRTDQRVAIVGRTGSGKTVFGVWLLSQAPFDRMPYVVLDYKRDKLIADISAKEIGVTEKLPKQPGVYVVRPNPKGDEAEVEALLWRIWERENFGAFFDEMYLLPQNSRAYRALQTQGRSKRIPTISLSQRPAWVPRFMLSEADYYSYFHLNHHDDRKAIGSFMPGHVIEGKNKPYHSKWYDLGQDTVFDMLPAPDEDTILDTFETRLKPSRKMV